MNKEKAMDIALLRAKLDNIAEELAHLPEQDIAIEEEHHEKDEDGNVIPHDDISEEEVEEEAVEERSDKEEKEREDRMKDHDLYQLMIGGPADSGIAKLPRKDFKKEEEEVAEEEAVEEAMVEIPVQELADIMQLAGYTDYAQRIEEYANEPSEEYSDIEDQMIGLSGGLNGPKKMYPASAPGDNPMDQEPREIEETMEAVEDKLYKSYQAFLEAEITEQD